MSAPATRLTLHLGAHRTASTRLQAMLRRAAKREMAAFAGPPEVRASLLGLVNRLGALPGGHVMAAPGLVGRLAPGIDLRAAPGALPEIVSDETLLGSMDRVLQAGAGLYPEAARRMRVLRGLLRGREVLPVLSVRSYAAWFPSAYATVIRRRPLRPYRELVPGWAALPRGWAEVVGDIAAVFGACRVLVYEDLALDERAHLRALIGADADRLRVVPGAVAFPSLPAAAVEALAADHAAGRTPDAGRLEDLKDAHAGGPPLRPFDAATEAALGERYAHDLTRIAAMGGGVELVRATAPHAAAAG